MECRNWPGKPSEVRPFRCSERSNETAPHRAGHQVQHHFIHGRARGDKSSTGVTGEKKVEQAGGSMIPENIYDHEIGVAFTTCGKMWYC